MKNGTVAPKQGRHTTRRDHRALTLKELVDTGKGGSRTKRLKRLLAALQPAPEVIELPVVKDERDENFGLEGLGPIETIELTEVVADQPTEGTPLTELANLNPTMRDFLRRAGIHTVEGLAPYAEDYTAIRGVGPITAGRIVSSLEKLTK